MTNRSKEKGTKAETDFVKYCNTKQGLPFVERRALNGTRDRGDIAGIIGVVIEIKDAEEKRLPEWKAQTLTEMDNDQAHMCALVVKVFRKPVAMWEAHVPLWMMNIAAGSGSGYAFYKHRQVWIRMNVEDLFHVLRGEGYL